MTVRENRPRRLVILAGALLVVLAAVLGVRIAARALAPEAFPADERPLMRHRGEAPAAYVPPPLDVFAADLPTPICWSCSAERKRPLEFQIDLDLLAPLGDGSGNSAEWLKDFVRGIGARFGEGEDRLVEVRSGDRSWKVLPPEDPLLLEAAPWVDQATCSFYPDIWLVEGPATPIPNMIHVLTLARSWVSRGRSAEDRQSAEEDFRRAVRVGRLMLQERVTVIQELVGLASVRLGAEALYEEARRAGDEQAMTVAALALADANGIRQLLHARMEPVFELDRHIKKGSFFGPALDIEDRQMEALIEMARGETKRPLRFEALLSLRLILHEGSRRQRTGALEALQSLSMDSDRLVGGVARWSLDEPYDRASWF